MIADLKPYAEYKEPGIAWLGRVPRHWMPTRLKHAFKRIIGGSTPASGNSRHWNGDVTWVTPADVSRSERLRRSIRQISRVGMLSCSTEMVPKGSIIVTSRAPVGNVAIAEVDLCTNQGCKALIPDHTVVAPMFGFWLLSIMKAELQSLSTGTTFSEVSTSRLASAFGILPPPAEQAAIVRFLGWANGRLERAIRAKRKVVALLNEQKQAIINRAVTRGLDPSVPLKTSGIPWLGDIPQHWALKRFKFLATVNSGQVDPRKAEYRNLILIAPNHIQSGNGRLLKQETADEQGADSGKYLVSRGQIIYSKIRPNLRKATIAPCDCLCSADMYPIAPTTEELSTDYLLVLLLSQPFTKFAVDTSMRVAMPKVNREALANCLMWYPDRQEQVEILGFIAREGAPLDAAIGRLEREINLLREYRTRLVADVVTGKIDVREAAARLPDEAVPDTAEDDTDLSVDPEPADEEAVV